MTIVVSNEPPVGAHVIVTYASRCIQFQGNSIPLYGQSPLVFQNDPYAYPATFSGKLLDSNASRLVLELEDGRQVAILKSAIRRVAPVSKG